MLRNLRRLVGIAGETPVTGRPTAISSPWTTGDLTAIVWADIFDAEWRPSTRAEAMMVPAIARGRHVLATTVARLPLREYELDGTEPLPRDQQSAWITRTDTAVSPFHRMLWTIDDLIFTGWSLWAYQAAADSSGGLPLTAERVNADQWHFDADHRVVVDAEYPSDTRFLLIPGPHEGILNFGQTTIRHAARVQAAAARAAESPTPTVELHNIGEAQLDQTEREQLLSDWRKARQAGAVAYTPRTIELRTHGAHSEQLLIDGRNAAAVDCARMISVPAATVDATPIGASLQYSTIEMRNQELVDYGLAAYAASVSARLSLDDVTPRGRRVSFDLDEFLPEVPLSAGGGNDARPGPAATQEDTP